MLTEEVEKSLILIKLKHYDGRPTYMNILFHRLKKEKSKSYVIKLKDDTSNILIDKNNIAEAFSKYYEELYKDEPTTQIWEECKY